MLPLPLSLAPLLLPKRTSFINFFGYLHELSLLNIYVDVARLIETSQITTCAVVTRRISNSLFVVVIVNNWLRSLSFLCGIKEGPEWC